MQFDESAYRQLRAEVYRLAYRQLRDHSASEDIVQDSFLRLALYRTDSISSTGGMVRKIAKNLIIDLARFRSRRREEELPQTLDAAVDEPSPEHHLLHKERVAQVSRILTEMPELRREVFVMRRLHGMSAKEVAAALSISPAAVDTHVARALLTLNRGMAILDADKAIK